MSFLKDLQRKQSEWSALNFPDQKKYQCLLGLVEEVGELAHAHLKAEQGIRTEENLECKRRDAVGDIVIFLAGYCNHHGLDLEQCIADAWEEVRIRDWKKMTGQKTVKIAYEMSGLVCITPCPFREIKGAHTIKVSSTLCEKCNHFCGDDGKYVECSHS